MPDHCCDSQAESMHSEFHSCVPCALQSKGTIQACRHVAITVTLQRNTFKFACKAPKGDVVICGVWASGNICIISFVLDHLKIWKFDQKKSSYEKCHQPDLRKFSRNFPWCGGKADHKDYRIFESKLLEIKFPGNVDGNRGLIWSKQLLQLTGVESSLGGRDACLDQLHWQLLSITTQVTKHLKLLLFAEHK